MPKRRSFNQSDNSNRDYRARDYRVQEPEPQSIRGKIQTTVLIKPVNESQKRMVNSIRNNTITMVSGDAGVGKGLISIYEGIKFINSQESPIKKLVYVRSNVGMKDSESIGALPGTLNEKMMVLAYPVLDNLIEFMEEGKAKFLLEKGVIECLPINFVRGRSFANSLIILDEAQCCTVHMLKAILTRVSHGTKLVLLGDLNQIDLEEGKSGFAKVLNALSNCPDVGIIKFNKNEVVRHPIIADVLERLNILN
jgi:phosphate starvation-inducible PhoH-like protein